MNHLDLFSGIGGFAYAVDQVWPGATHVFCDNDEFCQKVLAKHWPESKIYGDIRTLTDTNYDGFYGTKDRQSHEERTGSDQEGQEQGSKLKGSHTIRHRTHTDLLTGGFPCQPFSAAGKRRGTDDDRYLWPEMLRVIRLTKPTWVIGENVGGLVTWNEGMVLEQVCADLEAEGYEVQPLIIPACAKNAPHRRDRVWIVANSDSKRERAGRGEVQEKDGEIPQRNHNAKPVNTSKDNAPDTQRQGQQEPQHQHYSQDKEEAEAGVDNRFERQSWDQDWLEVATRLCGVDDGVSKRVDRLKALGNAIVPQVAIEIMKAIKSYKQE